MIFCFLSCSRDQTPGRLSFDRGWKFHLGDDSLAYRPGFKDEHWRDLDLPHDWSIEGTFSAENPSTPEGGALPTGTGWYRKHFKLQQKDSGKVYYIDFDGVFCNSEVWINGHYLGKRPFGYISFRYELTPYLKFGKEENILAVRVDNSAQPASRWYTGSGIYRHVWIVPENAIHVDHWGSRITTPEVSAEKARVRLELKIRSIGQNDQQVNVRTVIVDQQGQETGKSEKTVHITDSLTLLYQEMVISEPALWSVQSPVLYKAVTGIYSGRELLDEYETPFGIRYFAFHPQNGFSLNGKPLKIHGVNQHHDLGALGAAVNTRAMQRQLEILKNMGCNAIRMAHNPPAPELLDLCDRMGFLVIDEAFDEWKKTKVKKGYHLYWDEWHVRDLQDMVLRDRNHPSIIAWSIGNEIPEQFDSTGINMTKELVRIVKELDPTRPVTCALTETDPAKNFIYQSKALDLLSFNYKHRDYLKFPERYPGECMLASENMSALSTRGHYDFPSDSVRIWPSAYKAPLIGANADYTVSAYDHVYAYWGATHEETWAVVKNNAFIPGMFIWSGFDYLGEPLPYPYPARSSYLGIIDLCGFPKDVYDLYQSEWTDRPVLHVFPHWNWAEGQKVDIWAYYSQADEVELFVNGQSLGVRQKKPDEFHVMWRVPFAPGVLKAVSRKSGQTVLEKEVRTAGPAEKIKLTADRNEIRADGSDLSFITVKVTDADGIMVPDASNLIRFELEGPGVIAGVDNGYQASLEPFKANYRKAFNGMCLLIVQSKRTAGKVKVKANSDGLTSAELVLQAIK
jgi:beta-galactosidase